MIRIAVVEDEAQVQAQIVSMVRDIVTAHGKGVEIDAFYSADSLLAKDVSRYALILLDIQMPGVDGMTAAQRIRAAHRDVMLVFVTGMTQYALQGYRVEALDFLVKPISRAMMEDCLSRALRRLTRDEPPVLTIKSGTSRRRIAVSSISHAEAQGRHVTLHADGGAIPYSGTLSGLEAELSQHGFFRCHSAFLVSLAHVECMEGSEAVVAGVQVPVSKHRRKAFLGALAAYWGKKL